MYTFLLACIPVFILLYCTTNGRFSWKSFIPSLAFGFLVAFVFYICKKFMIFNRYVWTENAFAAAMNMLVFDIVIPTVACLAVFLIFDRSSLEFKAESFAPLMMSFYSFMLPFGIISGDDSITPFMVYGKPLLYAGMSILTSVFAAGAVDFFRKKNFPLGILFSVIAVAVFFIPPLVEASWYYTGSFFFVIVSIIFAVVSVAIYLARSIILSIFDKKSGKTWN